MLDEPVDAPSAASADQPKTPRRRRASGRPSGPPAPVELPVASSSPSDAESLVSVSSTSPSEQAAPPASGSSTPAPSEPASAEHADTGPETGVTQTAPDALPQQPLVTLHDSAPAVSAPDAVTDKPARASRSRRSRGASSAPVAESSASVSETAPVPDTRTHAGDDVPGTTSTSDAKPPRRTRGRQTAAEPAVPAVAPAAAENAPAAPEPEVSPLGAAPVEAGSQPGVGDALAALQATRPRRRSARRDAGAPAPIDLDAIRTSLTEPAAAAAEDEVELADAVTTEDPSATPEWLGSEGQTETEAETQVAVAQAIAYDDDQPAEGELSDVLTDDAESEIDADADAEADEDAPRRRRRRRGGRRRRRAGDAPAGEAGEDEGDDAEGDETSEHAETAQADETDADNEAEETDAEGAETEGDEAGTGSRRRRRRRRRGEDAAAADDDPSDVVVRVREPRTRRRSGAAPSDEVAGIEGSTRMEAKRQRRREGRAAGRRRAPILSESEFLARRESVTRQMLVRQKDDYSQIAVIEDGVLVEHYVDRASATSLIGNVYIGKVQNILPSMEAAFVDIGRGRNAVLYAGEVDWDSFGADGQSRKVEKVFKSGQMILVQVTKDPVGAKGARLTSHISLPGRYVVYAPGGNLSGISRKLPEQERNRLKDLLSDLVGEKASVIIRTAAEGASEEELVRDVNRLQAQWEAIEKKVKQGTTPQLLYGEPDLTVRIVRDLFTEDFSSLVIDGNGQAEDAYDMVKAYVDHVAPHLSDRMQQWDREQGDIFDKHRVDEQIAKALERKVFLPSGGSLIIDRTEAMTVIDVNTGKFTGSGGNLEATVTSNNLEAAEEIVRQLRLRDIGGIIVIDFIDMVLPSNRELLLRRLVECLGRDRTRHQVAEVTSLGLVQMTRKKIGTGLAEAFTETCDCCGGRGYHRSDEPVETQVQSDGGDRPNGRRGRRSS